MARPKLGIFSAMMALGGFLAVRYVQRNRAAQIPVARELHRWENEGGTAVTPTTNQAAAGRIGPSAHGSNGPAYPNGNGEAWPFPRS